MVKLNILCVIVLFERPLTRVASWKILNDYLNNQADAGDIHLLVYDNSFEEKLDIVNHSSSNVTYFHNPLNGGTAAAYSYAANFAVTRECDWLLLLDQDSVLPASYISSVFAELSKPLNQDLDVLVPLVKHANTIISPSILDSLGSIRPIHDPSENYEARKLTAIASGLLLKAESLRNILPFNKHLWLDYVDHWIFLKLNGSGSRIKILNETIQHELSIRSLSSLSKLRLVSILNGESIFYSELGGPARLAYPVRLFFRSLSYLVGNPGLASVVWQWFFFDRRR